MPSIHHWLRAAFRRDAMEREMSEEMRQHLEQATTRNIQRGMSREDARFAALREFGNVAYLQEKARDARGASWIESIRADLAYAARGLKVSPGFSIVAIASLALGIGANTAIFGLINSVVLRPLPVERPSEIVRMKMESNGEAFSQPILEEIRRRSHALSGVAASGGASFNLASGGEVRPALGAYVNGEYFTTLGIRPADGRLFSSADDRPGCARTAVLSHGFWQSEFGAAPGVSGRTISLSDKPYTIIGVAQSGFSGTNVGAGTSIFVPLCLSDAVEARSFWWLDVFGRLKPGSTIEQANVMLRQEAASILGPATPERFNEARRREFTSQPLVVSPAATGMSEARDRYSTALYVLMGMVGVVLLISCANVANLLLARGAAKQREMAVRVALGASWTRIVRQFLAESVLLAATGAILGVFVARWGTGALIRLMSASGADGLALDASIDGRVLAFTAAVSIATVILCGLAPAVRATRVDPQSAMKSGGRSGSDGPSRFRIGQALVVSQCALALVLVIAAGLLIGTFKRLSNEPLGFNPDGVVAATVDLKTGKAGLAQGVDLQRRLLGAITAMPGVKSASIANLTPIAAGSWNNVVIVPGYTPPTMDDSLAWFNSVSDGYFRTMGTSFIAGRDFTSADDASSAKVAIINRAAVDHFFSGEMPIGKSFRIDEQGKPSAPIVIVGVVDNSKYHSLREKSASIVYLPSGQDTDGWAQPTFLVRGTASTASTIESIKVAANRVDPRFSLSFRGIEEQVARSLQRERVLAMLSGFFGALALALAMIGLYGVMTYTVARRRVEIGIRIALGAARPRVIRMVLGDVARLIGFGIAIGGVAAAAVSRVLGSFLYGVAPRDPVTIVTASLLLAAAALIAGAIPARRAAGLEPVDALRED